MSKSYRWIVFLLCAILAFSSKAFANSGLVKGIYVTQSSLENTVFLENLIKHAKASGIDTFVVDLDEPCTRYGENIKLVKESGIRYVARITMFPGGGNRTQLRNPEVWQKKFALVQDAVNYGASAIQLDYIRYNTHQIPSDSNIKDVKAIIDWYRAQLAKQKIPMQIDVFGIASFGESKYIGQSIKQFANSVDAICPMVYPSHYSPFPQHFQQPYKTVYDSIGGVHKQIGDSPVRIYAYIELSNYHYPMSHAKTLDYIKAQVAAVKDSGADGWYAWSPHNRYDNLFYLLENHQL